MPIENDKDIATNQGGDKLDQAKLDKALSGRRNSQPEAEIVLDKHPVNEPAHAISAEKSLHELQMHQMELERQNTALRRAYAALEESRDRYLDLFEFAPVGYLTLTQAGLIEEINLSGAALIGLERNKLLFQPFSQYIAPQFVEHYHLHMSRFNQQYEAQSYELQISRKDGSLCCINVAVTPNKADDGTVVAHMTLTNITKRKRAENALIEREFLWKFAIEGSGFGVWDTNLQTGETQYSVRWKEMLGYASGETPPFHHVWLDHIHPDDVKYVESTLQAYLNGEADGFSAEFRMQCKNGSYTWIHSKGTIVSRNAEGKPLRMIGTQTDISERKQAEYDLRIAATAFETQEGVMVTDQHGIIVRTNRAFTVLTGYSAEEMCGKPVSLLKSKRQDTAFYHHLLALIGRESHWQGELWCRRKNADDFPAFMTITAVMDAEGYVVNYVGSFSDITLQKQAEKILLDSRKHLEKQVERTSTELVHAKGECEDANTALKVMIKMRRTENFEAKNLLALELKQEVLPFLARLKTSNYDQKQIRLINTLEANLLRLISTYGGSSTIASAYQSLTPKEIQVASMVREGFSTKVIASTLSLSPETISIHRKNIRKKLRLENKSDNLRSFLITNGKL